MPQTQKLQLVVLVHPAKLPRVEETPCLLVVVEEEEEWHQRELLVAVEVLVQ